MKKLFITAVLSIFVLSVSAQSKMDIELPAVKTVEVSGNIVLKLIHGTKNNLSGEMADDVSKDFSWQIKENNTLSVKLNKPTFVSKGDSKSIVLYLTFTDLENIAAQNGSSVINSDTLSVPYIRISSDGQSTVSLELDTKAVIANSSNKGKIVLNGKCDLLVAKARYSSSITAEKMVSRIATADSSVSAEIYVNASEILTTISSTNGYIYYKKQTPIIIPMSSNQNNIIAY